MPGVGDGERIEKQFYCRECGVTISKDTWFYFNGRCKKCWIKIRELFN